MRKSILLAVPAVLAVGILAGCSSTDSASGTGTVSSGAPSVAAASATPTTQAAASPKYGQTYTFPSGLKVSVSAPTSFTPSQYAAGAGAQNVKYTITVVNGTKSTFTPGILTITGTAGGQAGTSVEDSDQDISEFPSASSVAVGATTSWTFGFGFANATGSTIEIDPNDFTSKAVTFTS